MNSVYVFGSWHQGFVIAGVLAKNNFHVTCVVNSEEDRMKYLGLEFPVFEPGLTELLDLGINSGKIEFVLRSNVKIGSDSVVFLAHDTKVDEEDNSDLSEFESDLAFLLEFNNSFFQIIITAQIPVGTYGEVVQKYPSVTTKHLDRISIMPENLRLGKAIERFENPPLPVVGCAINNQSFWQTFFSFTNEVFYFCTPTEAELLKHALNSYLALGISFGNEVHRIGTVVGADGNLVMKLLELEPRIGDLNPKRPGLPFFGGTLARDLVSLDKVASKACISTPVIKGTLKSNESQKQYVLNKILSNECFIKSAVSSVCVIGLTYTAETSTLRRSPGLWLMEELIARGFKVTAYDPRVSGAMSSFKICAEISEISAYKIDCFILVSPWKGFIDEVSQLVKSEFFIDIESHLLQSGVALPTNYSRIF